MRWENKRYNSLDYHYKKIFGEKVYKLSLDAGFTCPNRDGKLSRGGCIFCSEMGSGDNAGDRLYNIKMQLQQQKEFLSHKVKSDKYIAYFQAYTNTYDKPDILKKLYMEAISDNQVVGLSIATRPDCIDNEVLEVLEEVSNIKPLWVELGLQTIRNDTARLINRCYDTDVFRESVIKLHNIGVEIVVHIIIGLPGEKDLDVINTVNYLNSLPINGIKFHLLHILKNTRLHKLYEKQPFHVYGKQEYCDLLLRCIEVLRPDIVIHRLTGDGPKDLLVAPLWSLKKIDVINYINHKLKVDDSYQGKYYE